jgi:hypothetical protein
VDAVGVYRPTARVAHVRFRVRDRYGRSLCSGRSSVVRSGLPFLWA